MCELPGAHEAGWASLLAVTSKQGRKGKAGAVALVAR